MKIFLVLLSLAAVALAEEEKYCYGQISEVCRDLGSSFTDRPTLSCNSKYLSFKHNTIPDHLQNFALDNVLDSYNHLLSAANFGHYAKNREGFQSFFQKLSDDTWESAIEVIKFIGKRGGTMNFVKRESRQNKDSSYEEYELGAMSNALDMTKDLAINANHIHAEVGKHGNHYDAEVSSYMEEHFVHKHSSLIRELSGHTNDLKKLYSSNADLSLSLFMFDEYLKH